MEINGKLVYINAVAFSKVILTIPEETEKTTETRVRLVCVPAIN
jgi:hypothetical protein